MTRQSQSILAVLLMSTHAWQSSWSREKSWLRSLLDPQGALMGFWLVTQTCQTKPTYWNLLVQELNLVITGVDSCSRWSWGSFAAIGTEGTARCMCLRMNTESILEIGLLTMSGWCVQFGLEGSIPSPHSLCSSVSIGSSSLSQYFWFSSKIRLVITNAKWWATKWPRALWLLSESNTFSSCSLQPASLKGRPTCSHVSHNHIDSESPAYATIQRSQTLARSAHTTRSPVSVTEDESIHFKLVGELPVWKMIGFCWPFNSLRAPLPVPGTSIRWGPSLHSAPLASAARLLPFRRSLYSSCACWSPSLNSFSDWTTAAKLCSSVSKTSKVRHSLFHQKMVPKAKIIWPLLILYCVSNSPATSNYVLWQSPFFCHRGVDHINDLAFKMLILQLFTHRDH